MRLFVHLAFILACISCEATESVAWRDYSREVTAKEKKDIGYIINTMGMSSLIGVAQEQSKLRKVGARVEHVHPLRFLMTIFTDEEMKTSMHALKDRMWIWDEFYSGLEKNLENEYSRGNISVDNVTDFAKKVKIDANLIYPYVVEHQWSKFLNTLIEKIPRKNNPNRYNM